MVTGTLRLTALGLILAGSPSTYPQFVPDARWQQVLALADKGGASNRIALEAIAKEKSQAPATLLARELLFVWDKKGEILASPTPRTLAAQCIPRNELERFRGTPSTSVIIQARVIVSQSGQARTVVLSDGGGLELREVVLKSLYKQPYCPAHDKRGFVEGELVLRCIFD